MSETDGLPTAQRRWVMGCALLGVVLAGLDSAIANIALPTIARELAATDAATIWVVNSYQIARSPCACCRWRRWARSLGLKRVYGFGLALFTLASLACALSPTLHTLVAARLLQGIGGACMAALGGALVRAIYPRARSGARLRADRAGGGDLRGARADAGRADPVGGQLAVAVPGQRAAGPGGGAAVPGDGPRAAWAAPAVRRAGRAAERAGARPGGDRGGRAGRRRGDVAIAELAAGLACGALLVWQQIAPGGAAAAARPAAHPAVRAVGVHLRVFLRGADPGVRVAAVPVPDGDAPVARWRPGCW